ncbi:FAD dependent oxidoreductase-domain-containing protein [Mycena vulgaris]|nr:FAD dependent oxidoreductase-domain-containing protein [Mycena vulgaris]
MSRYSVLLCLIGAASALSFPFTSQTNQAVFRTHAPADLPRPNPPSSFWTHGRDANPLAGEGSTGALTDEADVCIIGAGMTGVSAAYHLANAVEQGAFPMPEGQTKLRAVILEARDFCKFRCDGCAGRNGGNLTPLEFYKFRTFEARLGREAALRHYEMENYTATEMTRIARTAGWADAVELVEGGHMDVMLTEARLAHLRADFDAAVAAGKTVNSTWLNREEMQATYGTHNWGVRSPGYNVWPLKFVTQLFREANATTDALDLRLHTRTPVTRITPSSSAGRLWALATPRGTVQCARVLHATNGYASHLLPHMAGPGPAGIVPVRGQVIATRANASLAVLSKISGLGGVGYWHPRPVQHADEHPLVIVGGAREVTGAPFEEGVTDDAVLNAQIGAALRAFMPELFPGMYELGREPEHEWTGIMGYTSLEIPFVGPVLDAARAPGAYAGQYISAGYTGHGMPRAFACAEAVVGMLAAELAGHAWTPPAWFPRPFLPSVRDARE